MDLSSINFFIIFLLFLLDYSVLINAYGFQCLTCDNFIDGSGCGEFTQQIPVKTCNTFCYFAIIHNRSSSNYQGELPWNTLTRAIRDCSPYDDMSIESNLLLKSKLDSFSSSYIDIIMIKRCNSEQCNNDFYLRSDELMLGTGSSYHQRSFLLMFFSFVIIFYYSKSMF